MKENVKLSKKYICVLQISIFNYRKSEEISIRVFLCCCVDDEEIFKSSVSFQEVDMKTN